MFIGLIFSKLLKTLLKIGIELPSVFRWERRRLDGDLGKYRENWGRLKAEKTTRLLNRVIEKKQGLKVQSLLRQFYLCESIGSPFCRQSSWLIKTSPQII